MPSDAFQRQAAGFLMTHELRFEVCVADGVCVCAREGRPQPQVPHAQALTLDVSDLLLSAVMPSDIKTSGNEVKLLRSKVRLSARA